MPRALTVLLMAALAWSAAVGVASATIQDQVDAAGDGDTVTIPAGTHDEHVTITGKSLRLVGAGPATVLAPTAGAQPVIAVDAVGEHVVIENLVVQDVGPSTDGIVFAAGTGTLTGITAAGFAGGAGVQGAGATRVDVLGSTVTGNATGIALGPTPGTLRGNRIAGNAAAGLSASLVDAARNWWGCNAGPGAAGCDAVTGGAVTAPNLVLRLRSAFSQIQTGGATTELVADLTRDSAGGFAGTAFPDGTGVAFATALGTLTAGTAATSSGSAGTTLISGDTPGQASPTATLDQQSVSAPVTFTAPPATQTVTVTQPPATTTPPPTATTPTTPADGAKLLADARRAIGSKVVRLEKDLTPAIAYVARSVRSGRGTLTIPDQDVVSLLVLVCPAKACDAGVSARVTRTTRSGAKAKPFDLRRATFALAAGRQRVVAVRLTKSRRTAIKAAKSAAMTVTIAASDPAGNRNKTTMRVALKIR